jgi:hypothetical protein
MYLFKTPRKGAFCMAEKMVLVEHKVSGVRVELEERHLGGPLGHMYKVLPEGASLKPEVLAHPTTEDKVAEREAAKQAVEEAKDVKK